MLSYEERQKQVRSMSKLTDYHWPLQDVRLEQLARKITTAVLNEGGDSLDLIAAVRRVLAEEGCEKGRPAMKSDSAGLPPLSQASSS